MDTSAYEVEAEVEKAHWWFVGRRRLLARIVSDLGVPKDAHILDIGTSTGTNLRMLDEFGFTRFEGLDANDEAVRWCSEKGLGNVTKGDICDMPFAESTFDLVLATDVIEHVDDDRRALAEIYRVLKPGAPAIITVPAFQILWGRQDEVAHHKRRYCRESILTSIDSAGFACRESFYFNYLLFLPILAARQVIKLFKVKLESENQLNNPFINAMLVKVFGFDTWSARLLRPPFGVSFLAIAQKKAAQGGGR